MDEYKKELVEQNIGLAYNVANQFRDCGIEFEELLSECFMGLVVSADTYKNSKAKFTTYSTTVMRNRILVMSRKKNSIYKYSPGFVYLDSEVDEGCLISETIADQNDCFNRVFNDDLYRTCMSYLTDKEKEIFKMVSEGMTQRQIGERLHISQSNVSRICKFASKRIKEIMDI